MRVFYQFDFDTLSRSVKKQLLKSVFNPDYLVYADTTSNRIWFGLNALLILFCSILLWLVAFSEALDAYSALWEGQRAIIWYALLLTGVLYGAHAIWQRNQLNKKFHFLPGCYLFPLAIVDARSWKISVYDLAQLRKLEVTHNEVNGKYKKTLFKFNFYNGSAKTLAIKDRHKAELVLNNFNLSQGVARTAFQNRDTLTLNGFDPFLEVRKAKWAGALNNTRTGAERKLLDAIVDLKLPLALIAIALAVLLWYGKNVA
ncbi:hypothetical protein H8L32_08900 [Undibacterium sp. CY18W]|uniref:SMODS-associating 2TM beta-strand rich effector domain-containing protein n=1 Tax=Undibacterium hunanense TaxID=2762292 RepID=A0ABR6ZNW5_9BURK|nr:hypothetical protein [Undibacterium hunanense]MBC3917587.1 hypothetical protein [Undibacterium hunanense]